MPSLSPEIQSYQGQAGPDPTEDLFKQRFADMAYQTLNSKFAELGSHVVTFKITKVDVDEGSGIGVLILDYNQKAIYIPIIMVDSILKPMELFYYKELNVFLPLTLRWLDEIAKSSVDEMGESAKLPTEVPRDMDMRDLTLPPTTLSGRIGIASVDTEITPLRLFKEAEYQGLDATSMFLAVLTQAPEVALDGIKLAFTQKPEFLQKLAAQYGIQEIIEAMQAGYARVKFEKTAAVEPGKVGLFGRDTSAKDFHAAFGKEASAAYRQVLDKGYTVKDARVGTSRTAVKLEKPVFLNAPGPQPGWFRLYFADGAPGIYYVIQFPQEAESNFCQPVNFSGRGNDHQSPTEYLAIKADGKEAWTSKELVGEALLDDTVPEIANSKLGKMLESGKGDTPSPGAYGIFINPGPMGTQATKPFRIDKSITDGGVTRLMPDWGQDKYIIDGDPSRKRLQVTQGGRMTFVPNTAKFLKIMQVPTGRGTEDAYHKVRQLERQQKASVVTDPAALLRCVGRIISDAGATPVTVKKACMGQWWVGDGPQYEALSEGPAAVKVASIYDVSLSDAYGILHDAATNGSSDVFVMTAENAWRTKEAFLKLAQPPMPGTEAPPAESPAGGMPQGMPQGGMPPEAMGMPGMMAPPQPAVSPTELAIGEAVQELQTQTQMQQQQSEAQMMQLQQQMQMQAENNQQLVGVLQGIQQRSSELSSATGGGATIPPEAAQAPQAAAGLLAPAPEEPSQPPPPLPVMDQETTSPEMIAQQINPEMVDQTEDLQNRGLFDAAAVGMLAEAPLLQEIVATYVPNLEKAIDNLGRILTTLWMKEDETKRAIGDEMFIKLEEKLRNVFKNLGEIVLDLSHNATSMEPGAAEAQSSMM